MPNRTAKESFAEDITKHELTFCLDLPPYRSIYFKRPGSSAYRFNLVTWPGFLCYSGDMGCFTFHRLEDMFEFFRGDRVNLSYWGEKLEAVDKYDGGTTYSPDKAKRYIVDDVEAWRENEDISPTMYEEAMGSVTRPTF